MIREVVPLINKTRIFISSAYEEDLKIPRKIVKKHLEESGHHVPIFEDGDFGTWEKDTLKQCQDVVKASDVFVLLIHRKAGASPKLLPGNVTPAYLEYKAAVMEKKHILVFVSPEVKESFFRIQKKLESLHNTFLNDHHRAPDSPYDPFEHWIIDEIESEGLAKQFLETADPFIWAFLFELFQNGHWLYDFDISKGKEQAQNISAMLSTSLRSVIGFISERENIQTLKNQAARLLHYADYSLMTLHAYNEILQDTGDSRKRWSAFLEKAISFFNQPVDIVQAPDYNPAVVNTINDCFAAALYYSVEEEYLSLIGLTGDIRAPEKMSLDADPFKKRTIGYREETQSIYIAEPINPFVLYLHFSLDDVMTEEQIKAYTEEIERAVMEQNEYHIEYLKLLIGRKTVIPKDSVRFYSHEKQGMMQSSISRNLESLEKALHRGKTLFRKKR